MADDERHDEADAPTGAPQAAEPAEVTDAAADAEAADGPGFASGAGAADAFDATPPHGAAPREADDGGDVDDLDATEEAATIAELVTEMRARRDLLAAMPDGPRPRAGGENYKRRKLLVDWHLQVSYIGVYLTVSTLLVVGFVALNYAFASLYQRALAIQQQQPFAEDTNVVLLGTLNAVLLIVLVLGMAVYAIVQSHRIAGPVLRFRRALAALMDRDYDFHLQLRRKDYLQDVADQVNELTAALKAKDVVVADAVLRLEDLARHHPDLALELEGVAVALGDVVLPPEGAPTGADRGRV